MKQIAFLLMLLFLSFNTNAQTIEDVKKVLATKNPHFLQNFINNKSSNLPNVYSFLSYGEIISGYHREVLEFREIKPHPTQLNVWQIAGDYKINFITTSKEIIYYDLSIRRVIKDENYKEENSFYFETLNSFKNDALYTVFESTYKQSYHDTLNHNDLFMTDIFYSDRCGRAGIKPEYMKKLDSLILQKNVAELHQWLISPNAEKQVYAIRGFKTLTYMGYVLTNEDKRLFKFVKQKQCNVNTCKMCSMTRESFQEVVAEIDKLSKADLLSQNSK